MSIHPYTSSNNDQQDLKREAEWIEASSTFPDAIKRGVFFFHCYGDGKGVDAIRGGKRYLEK
jgi:hypothetical protein